jgi:hypothetical protein
MDVDVFIPKEKENVIAFYELHNPFRMNDVLDRAKVWREIGRYWTGRDSEDMEKVVDGWLSHEKLVLQKERLLLWEMNLVRFASEPVLELYLRETESACWNTDKSLRGCYERMNRRLWEAFFCGVGEGDFWRIEDSFLREKDGDFDFMLPEKLLHALFRKGSKEAGVHFVSCSYLMQKRLLEDWELVILKEEIMKKAEAEGELDESIMLKLIMRREVGAGWEWLEGFREEVQAQYTRDKSMYGEFWKNAFDKAWSAFEKRQLEETNGVVHSRKQNKVL